ncbi:MAG: peptidoglycan-binding protein [Alphaproteobacteria bacterium]|nr:peptidoglycan-binding protein [Alphaproteobacteria bacterium]
MFTRTRRHNSLDIWPGFVDAMATLLMVIVFVLMTFVVAQLYLTDALSTKDTALQSLEGQMKTLHENLKLEKLSKEKAHAQIENLQTTMAILESQVAHLRASLQDSENQLSKETHSKDKALSSITQLNEQIADLNIHIKRLSNALADEEAKEKEQALHLEDLKEKLNEALLSKVEELKALNEKLEEALGDNKKLSTEITKLKDPKKLGLTQYRSEFFAKLVKVLGERSDIRVVGDRFVFQSEVLFDKGSSDIKAEGTGQLKALAKTLKDITKNIPKDISWILRIDGHTDKLAINTAQFPSNWELSTARAIAVVKSLAKEGIDASHLVAAGFGEHQPLGDGKDEATMARNRRIEFKLDQR